MSLGHLCGHEAYLDKNDENIKLPRGVFSPKNAVEHHQDYRAAFYLHCSYDSSRSQIEVHCGKDSVEWFSAKLDALAHEYNEVYLILFFSLSKCMFSKFVFKNYFFFFYSFYQFVRS